MKLDTFINRPVLSTVISIFIVLLGLIGLLSLPVTQYPDIAPPTISVSTTYTGANAQAVLNSVIAPLEESINGAEGMTYMESTATNTGSATINVYFEQGFDPDMAAVDVQNRVAKAQSLLPAEVTQVGVLTQKRQTSMLLIAALYDDAGKYSEPFIENYMKINVVPEMQRISGVGDVMVMGADYSMRIWLKPDVMAQYNLMPTDISAALAEQNIEAAPGAFGEQGDQSFQYIMRYKGRLVQPEEFENIVVRANSNGEVLYLKDVADIELGRVTYGFHGKFNGKTSVTCIVFQTAGSKRPPRRHQDSGADEQQRVPLRLYPPCAPDTYRGIRARVLRNIPLPSGLPLHHHPRHRHSRGACRHILPDEAVRLLRQPHHTQRARACDCHCGGRRHSRCRGSARQARCRLQERAPRLY